MPALTWKQFQDARLVCDCGWQGQGSEALTGKASADRVDKHCPACGEHFGYVTAFPSVRSDGRGPRGSNVH